MVTRGLGGRRSQTRHGGRPPVRRRGMEAVAVFAVRGRLSCDAAMVGRGHVAGSRRDAPPSCAPQFHRPAGARHCRPFQFPPHQSGRTQTDRARAWGQPSERRNALFGRSSAPVAQRAQRGGQSVRAGQDRRPDRGRRRQAHGARRDHPLQPDDRVRPRRACRHRARVDHEILYPRSTAGDFADQASRRQRIHGLLHLVAQSDLARSRRRLRRLSARGPPAGKSLTLFAAQTDFTEPGELGLFIDDSQLALLEDVMFEQGVLESSQMAGTFHLMRSNDLVWSRVIRHYLMGEPDKADDISAWSSDTTRMPYRMHSEYLRTLFLKNDLAEGRFKLNGRRIALQDIRLPVFVVGAERDHVSPWRSVFKIHYLTGAEITFALANGGHNRAIVAPPGEKGRYFRISTTAAMDRRPDPHAWAASARRYEHSWWLAWFEWLAAHSSSLAAPPPLGCESAGFAPLAPAPGDYVRG